MVIDRRTFIALSGAALLTPWVRAANQKAPLWVSTGRDAEGDYWLAGLSAEVGLVYKGPLPGRGHGLAVSNDLDRALVFARRPGEWAGVFSPATGEMVEWLAPPADHFIIGHGCWQGSDCFVSLGTAAGQSRLGVWSATRAAWEGMLELPGIGIHEVIAHPKGEGLAVAIGGLGKGARDADSPFASSLLLLDSTGNIRAELPAPGPGFSVRHLAADEDWVYVGLQYYGPDQVADPLVYRVSWSAPQWQPMAAEPWQWLQMSNYIASVVCYPGGVTVSSPKGHHLMHWRADAPVTLEPMRDVAALARNGDRLWAGNGYGQWNETDLAGGGSRSGLVPLAFDNHGAVAWA